jgi:lipopolysaccharide transport system permease protein
VTAPARSAGVSRGDLFWTLVERQLRLRSKRSVMGVLWPFVAPLFLLALYSYIFGRVFEVPVDNYPAYLFAGLLPWTFLVQSVHDSLQSISFEPDLVRRAPFPYEYLPLSRVVVMAVPFVVLLVGFTGYLAVERSVRVELLALLIVPLAAAVLIVASLSMLLALLDVFNRDLRFVLHNLLTVWFFLIPIVYRPEMADGVVAALRAVDPMHLVVEQFRDLLYWGEVRHPGRLAALPVVAVALFAFSSAVFRRLSNELPKQV